MALTERFKRRPAKAAPAAPQLDLDRPTAHAIYEQVAKNARVELDRDAFSLMVSGLAGGMGMGLTALAVSVAGATLGPSGPAHFVACLLYPIGFIVVILGRSQLFTENTLYPVALMLAESGHFLRTARLWALVLPFNIIGAFLFAVLTARTGALKPEFVTEMVRLGVEAAGKSTGTVFWSAVVGGWIIAMVAWLVSGSHSITGSVALIWLLTFLVGLGGFAHCIASSGEILAAVVTHQLELADYGRWIVLAVAGNICGGVLLVTLLEYGQTQATEPGKQE
jgi:formate/nitrite transporter FocA (FNT family)